MTVASHDQLEALFDQLAQTAGKAEIIDGEIVPMSPTGPWPNYSATAIGVSLFQSAQQVKIGVACGDNCTFRVNLPKRQSFSPDAAYFIGTKRAMKHYNGSPTFAVEVRSSGDDGPQPERQIAAKRAEYFAAGTPVVWDVDLLSQDVVRVYRSAVPETPIIYRPGGVAEAEPAVPGWAMPVNDLLPEDWKYPFVDDEAETT